MHPKKHSTLHTLISVTEHIKNTIDNKNYRCGNFIDLKKPVNIVNHTILVQFVSVNGHSSMELEIRHGVPQG